MESEELKQWMQYDETKSFVRWVVEQERNARERILAAVAKHDETGDAQQSYGQLDAFRAVLARLRPSDAPEEDAAEEFIDEALRA